MILFFAPWFDDHTGELLLTRHIVDYAGGKLGHKVSDHVSMPGIWHNLKHSEGGQIPSYTYLAYVVVGQSLMTVVVGLIGGWLSNRFLRGSA